MKIKNTKGLTHRSMTEGFTLIELLVVVSIISLLSSVVMASLSNARVSARDTQRISDIRQMRIALELYRNQNGTYPPATSWATQQGGGWTTLQTALTPYMAKLPVDPVNNTSTPWAIDTTSYAYAYYFNVASTSKYDLVAKLENQSSTLRCAVKQWTFYAGLPPSGTTWCGSYSPLLYTGEY